MDRRRPSKLIENNTILVDNDDNGDGGFTSISDATIDDDDTEVDDEDDDEVDDNDDDDDDDTEVDDDDCDASHIILSTRIEKFHMVRPSIGLTLPVSVLAVMVSIDNGVSSTSLSLCLLSIDILLLSMLLMIMVS